MSVDAPYFSTTVDGCARCGQTHVRLTFVPFVVPIVIAGRTFQYWALCPSAGEPIIMEVVDDDDVALRPEETNVPQWRYSRVHTWMTFALAVLMLVITILAVTGHVPMA